MPVQCQRPVEGPSIALDLADSQGTPEEPGVGAFQDAAFDGDLQTFPEESLAADEAAQPRQTPRKLLRKAAPKRKRLGNLQAASQGELQFMLLALPFNVVMSSPSFACKNSVSSHHRLPSAN